MISHDFPFSTWIDLAWTPNILQGQWSCLCFALFVAVRCESLVVQFTIIPRLSGRPRMYENEKERLKEWRDWRDGQNMAKTAPWLGLTFKKGLRNKASRNQQNIGVSVCAIPNIKFSNILQSPCSMCLFHGQIPCIRWGETSNSWASTARKVSKIRKVSEN